MSDTYNFGPTVPALFAAHERRYKEAQDCIATLEDVNAKRTSTKIRGQQEEIESLRQQLADFKSMSATEACAEIPAIGEYVAQLECQRNELLTENRRFIDAAIRSSDLLSSAIAAAKEEW